MAGSSPVSTLKPGLAPIFEDAEVQRIYWEIVERDGLEREPPKP